MAGEHVARESEPISEHAGVVTVACRSAVWAQQLELLSGELLERLNAALVGVEGGSPITRLRFVTRAGAGSG